MSSYDTNVSVNEYKNHRSVVQSEKYLICVSSQLCSAVKQKCKV